MQPQTEKKEMNISKIETFIKVIELGSLTKAAEQLGCTQSAVSHIINDLEEEFGFSLLARGRNGVKLTSDGERLVPTMRTLLNANEQLDQIAASVRGLASGTVRIGTFTSVAVHWLPRIIKDFNKLYPNIEFKLFNGDYHDIEKWLGERSIDIGFVALPMSGDCECTPLIEDRVLAVLPKNHPYAAKEYLPLKVLNKEPFISLLETSDHDVRHALEGTGVQPKVRFFTKDDYAIIAMVEQGLGISIMPELLLKNSQSNIAAIELENHPTRVIGIAVPPSAKASPATKCFAEFVVDWIAKNSAANRL